MSTEKARIMDLIPENLRAQLRSEVLEEIKEESDAKQNTISDEMKEWLERRKLEKKNTEQSAIKQ